MLDQVKRYKLFLVEEDDDMRERVLSAKVRSFEIKHEPEYDDIHVDASILAVNRFVVRDNVTLTLNLEPQQDGVVFRVEDFTKEDEDEPAG